MVLVIKTILLKKSQTSSIQNSADRAHILKIIDVTRRPLKHLNNVQRWFGNSPNGIVEDMNSVYKRIMTDGLRLQETGESD